MEKLSDRWMYYSGILAMMCPSVNVDDLKHIQDLIDAEEQRNLVEVVHGEWKWLMRGGKTYCSKCGKLALRDQDRDDWWYYVQSDFCPNCGADMRKGGAK